MTWSRGCEIFRSFSFHDDNEAVACALFTTFRRGRHTSTESSYKGKEKERQDVQHSEAFGPFHTAHTAHWGQANISSSDKGTWLERALVIVLQTKAYIYFPSGDDLVIHLPFTVEKAWPLSTGGIMVQRALERREIRRLERIQRSTSVLRGMDVGSTSILDSLDDLEDDAEELPIVWTLTNPFEEFKMVTEDGMEDRPAIPSSWNMLHAGDDFCPLIVAHDPDANLICFYAPKSSPSRRIDGLQSVRTMRPEELLRQPEVRGPRPSLGRVGSFAKKDRRQSGKIDPLERTTRRAPRLSRNAATDKESPLGGATGDLHAALDPPPFAVTVNQPPGRRIVSGASSIADKGDRRGSGAFMREDMGGGLHAIREKDLRETTMLMGLERHQEADRSEIVLSKIASCPAPP
jgi:anaphase-promoting complex subunit 1